MIPHLTPTEILSSDLATMAQHLRDKEEPFAFATIVRTAGTTAAKPGVKAIIDADGAILVGFLGGGCTRGAVRRAVLVAIETGAPQLISVAPQDRLDEIGVTSGVLADGVTYARNGCPSRGTVDIFIEPCVPMPELAVLGTSPVAEALRNLALHFHWSVESAARPRTNTSQLRTIVVATQGQGDLDALKAALDAGFDHISFVGSVKKFASLAEKLTDSGVSQHAVDQISAPAGLHIGAITPEEIALSILAELTKTRRLDAVKQDMAHQHA